MPKIAYIEKRLSPERLVMVGIANAIISEYAAQGFDLTLRQLYYQMVSRDHIPNNLQSYKRLGDLINDARLLGLVDWDSIVDRTRNLARRSTWNSTRDIMFGAAGGFHLDSWRDQTYRVEVWIEKDALVGVIDPVCRDLDIPYFACRGYTSQSEMWSAAQRHLRYADPPRGKRRQIPVVIYLGDHDPSGIDMTRDVADRLGMFTAHDAIVRRIALNYDQVEDYNPPPNPTKMTDARASGYIDEYGHECWELDALDPNTIAALIRDEVDRWVDDDMRQRIIAEEEQQRAFLRRAAQRWDEVVEFLNGGAE